MNRKSPLLLLAALAVAVVLGVFIWRMGDDINVKGGSGEAANSTEGSGKPSIGGPFALTDQTGARVTEANFAGQYMLIYFGFTFCPDVCPTELQVMSNALAELGEDAQKIQPILITIDPERDTPEVLATYVKQFDPRLIGLTGSLNDMAAVAKAYRVYYEKVKDDSSSADYTMDHSSVVYLMGPDGEFLTFFGPGTSPDKMAEKIKSLM